MALTIAFLTGAFAERPTPPWTSEDSGRLLAAAEAALAAEHIASPRAEYDPYQPLLLRLDLLRGARSPDHLATPVPEHLDAFYGSLAMAGRSALLAGPDPDRAEEWLARALKRASEIRHWTGRHSTSHGFIFQVVELFPPEPAARLVGECRVALLAWDGTSATDPLRELALLTIRVAPDKTRDLLHEVALESHHFSSSIELLGAALAREDPERALEEARSIYDASADAPVRASRTCASYYLRSVLFVLAEKDLGAAIAGLSRMRGSDAEIGLLHLAERLIAQSRQKDAATVLDLVARLDSRFNWTIDRLARLRKQLSGGAPERPVRVLGPEDIDAFLDKTDDVRLRNLGRYRRVVFRDRDQMRAFIGAAPKLAARTRAMCERTPGAAKASVHGLAMLAATELRDVEVVLECAGRIEAPSLRAHYLLEAVEAGSVLPEVARSWPIRFLPRVEVFSSP